MKATLTSIAASQVRIKSGCWVDLGRGADSRHSNYYLDPGETFQRFFELRQGCNANRRYRFYFRLGGQVGKRWVQRDHIHCYPSSGYTNAKIANLGNVARFFAEK